MLQWVATHGEHTANTSRAGKGFSVLFYLFIYFLQMRIQSSVGMEWDGDLGGAMGRGEYG